MSFDPSGSLDSVTAEIELGIGNLQIRAKMEVPAGPTKVSELLPLAQSLANHVVHLTVLEVEEQGKKITCKKGCGACCRQLVPISEVEARRIRDLVNEMPEPRRSQVRARFAEARRRLEEAGLLEKLLHVEKCTDDEAFPLAVKYFKLGIPCPFLEEESCSIHPDRPIICREYLVTSPAENCARLGEAPLTRIKLPLKVAPALSGFDGPPPEPRFLRRSIPLVLAPEWAAAHPEEPPPRPGPELLRQLLERITGKGLPGPPSQEVAGHEVSDSPAAFPL